MHILRFNIVNQDTAVHVAHAKIHAVVQEQISDDALAERPKVARHNRVVVVRRPACIGKVCG